MSIERWVYRVFMRVRAVVRGSALDADLDEELRDHLDHLVAANIGRGLPPDEARRQALLAMGGLEQRKEECRDTRRVAFVQDVALMSDVLAAARAEPAFQTRLLGVFAGSH